MIFDHSKNIFFAKQVAYNLSALQSLLSILFNNESTIRLPKFLRELYHSCLDLDDYSKGLAIAEQQRFKDVCSLLNQQSDANRSEDSSKARQKQLLHCIAYIYKNGCIYELDGIQEGPIVIAEGLKDSDYLAELRKEVQQRFEMQAINNDRCHLMVVKESCVVKLQEQRMIVESKILRLLGMASQLQVDL